MERMTLEHEVDRNFDALVELLPTILPDHKHEYVLMRGGAMISFHRHAGEALSAGRELYADGRFSVQEVTDVPVELGVFSHAVDPRIA